MLQEISYFLILGKPLIWYLGIITISCFLITAVLGFFLRRHKVQFKWHKSMAIVSIIFAIIHGSLGLLLYF
ncbi:MAG TPA: hypothetical protein VI977_02945 [archaeon]|nr:hypothetical protein [archaeon]